MKHIADISDPYVTRRHDRWFIHRNIEYSHDDGTMSTQTECLCGPSGFGSEKLAEEEMMRLTTEAA